MFLAVSFSVVVYVSHWVHCRVALSVLFRARVGHEWTRQPKLLQRNVELTRHLSQYRTIRQSCATSISTVYHIFGNIAIDLDYNNVIVSAIFQFRHVTFSQEISSDVHRPSRMPICHPTNVFSFSGVFFSVVHFRLFFVAFSCCSSPLARSRLPPKLVEKVALPLVAERLSTAYDAMSRRQTACLTATVSELLVYDPSEDALKTLLGSALEALQV